MIVDKQSITLFKIDRNREQKRTNADEKASFLTRNFPQDNSFNRRDSARVYTTGSQKEGRKDTTQEHLSLAFRAAREKGKIHGSTRCSVLYIHIYTYIF